MWPDDGSDESEQALVLGRRLAPERHAELLAFEAIRPPLYIHDPWSVEGETEEQVAHGRQRIRAVTGQEAEVGSGDAADELAQLPWAARMAKMRRKTLVVCQPFHDAIHHG